MKFAITFRYDGREYYTELSTGEEISFGCHKKDDMQIPNSKEHLLTLRVSGSEVKASVQSPLELSNGTLQINMPIALNKEKDSRLYISRIVGRDAVSLKLPYQGEISCGRGSENDLVLSYPVISRKHFQLMCENGIVHIEDLNSTNHLYLNGKRISKAVMKAGDVLSVYTFRFRLEAGRLYFENMGSGLTISNRIKNAHKPQEAKPVAEMMPKKNVAEQLRPDRSPASKSTPEKPAVQKIDSSLYLNYRLSPRTREQLPHEPVILANAPGAAHGGNGHRGNLAYLISSGAMFAASLATGMISPAALMMKAVGLISPVASMAMQKKMNKEEQEQLEQYEKLRQERYHTYIAEQKARIKKVADIQRRVVSSENQPPVNCMKTVMELRRNLWERMPSDNDFLVTRLGIGKEKLCVEVKSRADVDGFQMVDDELEQLSGQIIEETRYVEDMPVCVSMKKQRTIGIVGPKASVYYQLRSILVELTVQHSQRDVRLACLFDDSSRGNWGVLRWLPHIWDETGQVRYIAFDEKRRHDTCELLAELFRQRKTNSQEYSNKKEQQVLPHYIVVIENQKLIYQEPVYDELVSNNPSLGTTVIFLGESMYDLPQSCQYLIDLTDKPCAYEREKYDERIIYKQDEPVHQAEIEGFARRMAAVELEDRRTRTALPSAVTFLQGYGVERVEELQILKRWKHNETWKTLAAPVGVMENGKLFSLDIRSGEQSHGPHGLLAGTTGSGKSELLQSWILSMAVNYHPYDVNFVIIDYKGGGMSDLMEPLPHVVGKITNIGRNISRSLISLKSEIKRRQQIFAQYGVNNISKYQKSYKEGIAAERLPHLIIVTDEFAEMKKEEPEFMTELNSIAAVGRSLGIHLLLATQKPAGVVTDQINSNSRFRICMKVQDVADSREMLKRPDAARITQAGRAYIRVGEDEIFELFQSFYSAAEYTGSQAGKMVGENRVRIVGVNGNRIQVSKRQKKRNVSDMDELTAVIHHINQVCESCGIEKLSGPWLPELTRWLTFADLGLKSGFDGEGWPESSKGLLVPIGKYDVPELQKQGVQYLDFLTTGHYGIFGAPSSGKTTLLKSMMMAIGMYYTPKDVNITVIDAGSWSLKEFGDMPHVREVILNQEEDKLKKFMIRIQKELESRKRAFLKHAVSSITAYWEAVSRDLPSMVVVIDNIRPLFDQYYDLGEVLKQVASNGAAYGIYLVFTANSPLGIQYQFLQTIKGTVALQMTDKGDYSSLVGSVTGVSLPQFAGRALMKSGSGNTPVAFQTVMYADAKEETQRHQMITAVFKQMKNNCREEEVSYKADITSKFIKDITEKQHDNQREATSVSVISESEKPVKQENFADYAQWPADERNFLPIGISSIDLQPVRIPLADPYLLLISSEDEKKNQKVLKKLDQILSQRQDNQIIYLDESNAKEQLDYLVNILNDRKKSRMQRKSDPDFEEGKWLAGYTQICLLIADLKKFASSLSEEELKGYRRIFTKAAGLGMMILVAGIREQFTAKEADLLKDAAVQAQNVLAFDGYPYEHLFAGQDISSSAGKTPLDEDEAAWIQGNELIIIRYE